MRVLKIICIIGLGLFFIPSFNYAQTITVSIDTSVTGIVIDSNFVGFSFNPAYNTQYFGTSYNGNSDRVITTQLLHNISPYLKPSIRMIGSNSAYWKGTAPYNNAPANWNNTSSFNCSFCPTSTTPTFNTVIDSTDLIDQKAFVEGLNYKPQMLYGLNLSVIDSARTRDFVNNIKSKLSILTDLQFEIGNEPDLFVNNSRRNAGYNIIPFVKEYNLIAKSVFNVGYCAGPTLAKTSNTASGSWSDSLFYYLDSAGSRMKTVTYHDYPLGSSTGSPSVTNYLNKFLSNQYTFTEVNEASTGLIPSISLTKNRGLKFRVGELNSVSSGGLDQVSNSFGAALWAMDFMFELYRAGGAGVNFATEGSATSYYSPFSYNSSLTGTGKVAIRPLYYGILFFSKAVQNGGQLVKQTYTSAIDSNQIKIWTLKDKSGVLRTMVIYRGSSLTDTSTKTIQLTFPGRVENANVYLLKATSNNGIADTSGVTIAGQQISNLNGSLVNTQTFTSVTPVSGVYSFNVKASTAVLFELPPNNCSVNAPIGISASRCGSGTITLTATPGTGETIDWYNAASGGTALLTGSTTFTTPTISATTIYYAQSRNISTGCVSLTRTAVTASITNCSDTLHVKLLLQGYVTGTGNMLPVLMNQGVSSNANLSDSVTIELHSPTSPYSLISSGVTSTLNTDGTGTFVFNNIQGSFYIVVKHRNSIQTWSATPVTVASSFSYDFTTAANKAFGNNMIQIGAKWAILSGDINQDGFVNAADLTRMETDNMNGVLNAYSSSDLNGDGFVDSFDYYIFELNNQGAVSVNSP